MYNRTCMDAEIHCYNCQKLVKKAIFNVTDYVHCDLFHVYCTDYKRKLDSCPQCNLVLQFEEKKNPYYVQGNQV